MITFTTRRETVEYLGFLREKYKSRGEIEHVDFHESSNEILCAHLECAIGLIHKGAKEYIVVDNLRKYKRIKRSFYFVKWVCKDDHFRWDRCYRSKKDKKKKIFSILIYIDKGAQKNKR